MPDAARNTSSTLPPTRSAVSLSRGRTAVVVALFLFSLLLVPLFWPSPYPQDPAYHHFADTRALPNAWNVLSNLGFIVVGSLGLWWMFKDRQQSFTAKTEAAAAACFFIGTLLTGAGSWYYHLAPTDATLVWDRLPMTVLFAGFVGLLLADRVSTTAASIVLPLYLIAGIATVFYWRFANDLRPYGLIQFFPAILVAALLFLRPRSRGNRILLLVAGFFVLAKICELADRTIYGAGHLVSGHTLKHLIGALAAYCVLRWLQGRAADAVTSASS